MVGPALVVGRRALDARIPSTTGQAGAGHVVVDAPARVVVEGAAPVGPPAVRPISIWVQSADDVGATGLRQQARQPGAFCVQETGVVAVVAPVLQIRSEERRVGKECISGGEMYSEKKDVVCSISIK